MHTLYFSIQLLGLALVLTQIFILYRRISIKNQALVLLCTIFVGINAYGYLIELESNTMQAALAGVKIAYLGKVYMLFTITMVVAHLTCVKLPNWLKISMFAVATGVLALVGSCEYHTFYYKSIGFSGEGQFPHLILEHGIAYYIYFAYIFACLAAGIGMCIYGYCQTTDQSRRMQILHIVVVYVMMALGIILFTMKVTGEYDITALFNCLSIIFLMRLTLKYNLLDVLSAAKDQVLDEIGTGVVIIDKDNRLLYANQLAQTVYPHILEGEEKEAEAIADILQHASKDEYKFFFNKVYTVSKQSGQKESHVGGSIFVLNDVTISYYYAQMLVEEVDEKTTEVHKMQDEMEQFYFQVIKALSTAVEAKDRYTKGHSTRVAEYAREIARRMGMTEEEQREIFYAGLLHDIGKIRVPDFIINKEGKLTEDEFANIKLHAVSGYNILKNVSGAFDVMSAARWHHERYDGNGYPDGLAGENIPLIARIICVADSYDAMTSNRSYRNALPQEAVREEIAAGKGKQFDPKVADIMLQMIDEDTDYLMRQSTSRAINILLADNNENDLDALRELTGTHWSYSVTLAQSVEECKQAVVEQDIDVVIIDMDTTGEEGYNVINSIQTYGNIPIILMTENKGLDVVRQAAELGVQDYLIKPFLPQALVEILQNVMQPSMEFKK